MKRLLDRCGGVHKVFHHDDAEDKTHVQTVQDVEPILENNKRLQSESDEKLGDWGRRVASIPLVIANQWMAEDGVNWLALPKDEKARYLRRKLNDPQYRHLRTHDSMM